MSEDITIEIIRVVKVIGIGNIDLEKIQETIHEIKYSFGSYHATFCIDFLSLASKITGEDIFSLIRNTNMLYIIADTQDAASMNTFREIGKIAYTTKRLTIGILITHSLSNDEKADSSVSLKTMEFKKYVDCSIPVPHEKLSDELLIGSIKAIYHTAFDCGWLDFADVRSTLKDAGLANFGVGQVSSENRDLRAAENALSQMLLNMPFKKSTIVLISISSGPEFSMLEIDNIASMIQERADDDVVVIFGYFVDECIGDEIAASIIAVGFKSEAAKNWEVTAEFSLPSFLK